MHTQQTCVMHCAQVLHTPGPTEAQPTDSQKRLGTPAAALTGRGSPPPREWDHNSLVSRTTAPASPPYNCTSAAKAPHSAETQNTRLCTPSSSSNSITLACLHPVHSRRCTTRIAAAVCHVSVTQTRQGQHNQGGMCLHTPHHIAVVLAQHSTSASTTQLLKCHTA